MRSEGAENENDGSTEVSRNVKAWNAAASNSTTVNPPPSPPPGTTTASPVFPLHHHRVKPLATHTSRDFRAYVATHEYFRWTGHRGFQGMSGGAGDWVMHSSHVLETAVLKYERIRRR